MTRVPVCDVCRHPITELKKTWVAFPAYGSIEVARIGDERYWNIPLIAHVDCFADNGYYFSLDRIVNRGIDGKYSKGDSLADWTLHLRGKEWWWSSWEETLKRAHRYAKQLSASPPKSITKSVKITQPQQGKKMPKISIYLEGEDVSVVTDARDERDFTEGFAPAFGKLIAQNGKNPPGVARATLTAAFDIVAKLRGYKSSVQERRVLAAGRWPHPTEKPTAEVATEDTPAIPDWKKEFDNTASAKVLES